MIFCLFIFSMFIQTSFLGGAGGAGGGGGIKRSDISLYFLYSEKKKRMIINTFP